MKRGFVFLLVILWTVFFLSGCWNRREIDTLAFVMAFGVDQREDDRVEVTVQVAKPGALVKREGGGEKEKPYKTYSASGKILSDAVSNLTKESPRKLWFGHTQFVLIGEDMARRGAFPVLDFVARDPELRREIWVLVTRGKAKDLLEADVDLEKIPATGVLRLIKISGATSMAKTVRANEFLKALSYKHISATAALITLLKKEPGGDGKPALEFHLEGSAVFKDGKLIGFLDGIETRGMLWVTGKVKSGTIIIPCPKDEREKVALEIVRARGDIEPRMEDGEISFAVKITEEGNIGEQTCPANLATPSSLKELERKKTKAIEEEIGAALRKARELKADIFGFGEALHRKYPSVWRELKETWENETFPEISVVPEIKAKLRRTGKSRPIRPLEKGTR